MPDVARVLIVDDDPAARADVRRALTPSARLRIVAEADNGADAWQLLTRLQPDIAIVDIGMPEVDGMTLARRIREHALAVDVIFLTVCDDEPMLAAALEIGTKGYLLKQCTAREMRASVEAVAAGEYCASPRMVSYIVRDRQRLARSSSSAIDDLTMQERAILRRIGQNKSSKEIASELGISTRTVDSHRSNICRTLGIHGNYALTRFASAWQRGEAGTPATPADRSSN
jgi:DNA-binding NarL/FixJ family response regulator